MSEAMETDRKGERFELIGSLESFSVIFLTVPVAALMKKVRAVPQMTLGLAVGSCSWLLLLVSQTWQAAAAVARGRPASAPRADKRIKLIKGR